MIEVHNFAVQVVLKLGINELNYSLNQYKPLKPELLWEIRIIISFNMYPHLTFLLKKKNLINDEITVNIDRAVTK